MIRSINTNIKSSSSKYSAKILTMDYNVVCKDPSFIGICSYLSNIYKIYKAAQDDGFNSPPFNPNTNPSPIPQPPNHTKDCQPDRFSYLIGSIFDPKTKTFNLKEGRSVTLSKNDVNQQFRIIGPSSAITADYRIERLNIYYDNETNKSEDEGIVTKVNCG